MTIKNKYIKGTHISERKFREILRYFSADLPLTQIAQFTKLNRNTINRIIHLVRLRIYDILLSNKEQFTGQIEVDESYFGAKRVKGKRGRGASGKTIVFGLLKRGGKVYTEIVKDCSSVTLQAVIRGKVIWAQLSILMVGEGIMVWLIWVIRSI